MGKRRGKKRRGGQQQFEEREYRDMGQRVLAAIGQNVTSTRIVLPANVAITSSFYVNLTGLEFPVVAGQFYHFFARIAFLSSSASGGSGWAVTGPALPTRLAYIARWNGLLGAPNFESAIDYDDIQQSASSAGAGATSLAIIEGIIEPSVDGTVVMRGAGESTFTTTALGTYSYVEFE